MKFNPLDWFNLGNRNQSNGFDGKEDFSSSKEEQKEGLVYEDSPNQTLAKEYDTIGPVVNLEEKLLEKFDTVKVQTPSYSWAPDNPEYAFDKKGNKYPLEVSYQMNGLDLTVSDRQSDSRKKVKVWAEAANEQNIKSIFEIIDNLNQEHSQEYKTVEESFRSDNNNQENDNTDERSERLVAGYSWKDVGGLEQQKREIRKYVEWPLEQPELFQELDIEPPRGIVLYGPPGTGKTLIAKTIASETKANFYSASASDLTSKWYGNSSTKVDNLFKEARSNSPSIVFLDEVDSLFKDRENSHEATQRMVTTFLKNLDGIDELRDVTFVGATNRLEDVDEAILRSGRLGRQIEIPAPDRQSREEILRIHTRNSPVEGLDYDQLSKETEEMTGADLEELVNQAGFYAIERNREETEISDIELEDLKLIEEDFYEALDNL